LVPGWAAGCTQVLRWFMISGSASSTLSGRCGVAPESRYTNGFPSRTVRLRIGKSVRMRATSSVWPVTGAAVISGSSGRGLSEAVVAVVVEFLGEFRAALGDDAAADEHVHELRLDVAQDAGVVGDQQHAAVLPLPVAVHALGHDAQRVDVQAGVGLVQDGDLRLEQRQLQDLVALLLAAGEALVDAALGEGGVDLELAHRLLHLLDPVAQLGGLAAHGGRGGTQEVR